MKACKLVVEKLSTVQPITELKATISINSGTSIETIFSRLPQSRAWITNNLPDFQSRFALTEEQANDVRVELNDLVHTYANGNSEDLRSMLQTSISCRLTRELSWTE